MPSEHAFGRVPLVLNSRLVAMKKAGHLADVTPAVCVQVYAVMAGRWADPQGRCRPAYETIADECGITEKSVRRALAVLRKTGAVTWASGRGRTSNTYSLTGTVTGDADDQTTTSGQSRPDAPDRTTPLSGQERPPSLVGGVHPEWSPVSEEPDPVEPDPIEPAQSRVLELISPTATPTPEKGNLYRFAEFWKLYPRKVGKSKAERIYIRLCHNGRTPVDPEAIIAGLQAHLPEYATRDPQFVPHATTWLNERRWEDEAADVRVTRPVTVAGTRAATRDYLEQRRRAANNPTIQRPLALTEGQTR